MSYEFNRELWEEKFANISGVIDMIRQDLTDIKNTIKTLIKLSATAIIAVCGWSLVQLYGTISHNANIETLSIAANHK